MKIFEKHGIIKLFKGRFMAFQTGLSTELWHTTLHNGSKHVSVIGIEQVYDHIDPSLKVYQFFFLGFYIAIGFV